MWPQLCPASSSSQLSCHISLWNPPEPPGTPAYSYHRPSVHERGGQSQHVLWGFSSSLSVRTWHKAELDKNCLFSKTERRGMKNCREERKWERKRTQCSTSEKWPLTRGNPISFQLSFPVMHPAVKISFYFTQLRDTNALPYLLYELPLKWFPVT